MSTFRDYAEEINTKTFEVYVPEYYDRQLPKYFEEKKVNPIYNAFDLNECVAMHCLAEIIDLTINKIPYTIAHADDMEVMMEILKGYVAQMHKYSTANDEMRVYISNVEITMQAIGEGWNTIKRIKRKAKLDDGEVPTLIEWFERLNPRKL